MNRKSSPPIRNFTPGLNIATGLGIGAGLMYYLDPDRGAKRRSRAVEKSVHTMHRTSNLLNKASRDAVNRSRGLIASARSSIVHENNVDDDVLVARVRAKIGRYVSHPHAIQVLARDGLVILRGLALAQEIDGLLDHVRSVHGVSEIDSQLEIHKKEDRIPSLQGGTPRRGEKIDILQSNWAPSTRVIIGALGGLGSLYGIRRRDALGTLLGFASLGFLMRAYSNIETKRLVGIGGRRAVTIHKSINVDIPVDEAFSAWSNLENLPELMGHVREVRVLGNRRSRWTIAGPAELPISWVAETTRLVPNELIAWRSIPGSAFRNAGRVQFRKGERGGTRIDLDFSYHPPGGVFGQFLASLASAAAKRRLDDSLGQMKTVIEKGPSERRARSMVGA